MSEQAPNEAETAGGSVTEGLPDLRFLVTRRNLIAHRAIVGAKTPKGHACSNLIEQLDEYQTATGDQKAHLERMIPLQMARLQGAT